MVAYADLVTSYLLICQAVLVMKYILIRMYIMLYSFLASPNITSLKAISSTALQASWISPSVGRFNVSVLGYEASCTDAYGNNHYMYYNFSIVTTVNITGLLPFTFYTCCIRAVSNMGNGALACGPIVQTLESSKCTHRGSIYTCSLL